MTIPKIAIYSIFRDNEGEYITKYFDRVTGLDYPGSLIRIYCGEGDSTDDTLDQLLMYGSTVIKHDTGRERMYHTADPYRLKTRALTGNAVYDKIAEDHWADYVLHLESDLEYQPDLITRLLESLPEDGGVISPMIWGNDIHVQTKVFYDVWAFTDTIGQHFPPCSPAWYKTQSHQEVFEIGSSGSCVLFRAELIYDGLRLTEDEEIKGMTKGVRKMSAGNEENGDQIFWKLYCNPHIHVVHPPVSEEELLLSLEE